MRFTVFLLVGLLFGCVTLQDKYGSGPIELAGNVLEKFERYKAEKKPGFFAVSVDGRFGGYSRCNGENCSSDWEYTTNIAKFSCEKYSNGVPCKIYARGLKVVWKKF